MSAMTLTEKILARHAGRDRVVPGDNIWVDVDVLMTHDVCGPGTIGIFKQHFGQATRRSGTATRSSSSPTTTSSPPTRWPTATSMSCGSSRPSRSCRTSTTSARRRYKGVCHIALPEEGPHPARRSAARHRQPHLHRRGVRRVRHRHRQHRRRLRPGHRQALGQGAADDAVRLPRRAAALPDGQGPDPGGHRRHRLRRRHLPGDGVRRRRRLRPQHRGAHDAVQHGHRGRRQERRHRPGPGHARLRQRPQQGRQGRTRRDQRPGGEVHASRRSTT